MKIQSDEISMERRAGFAHAAPNCPNLAQGVAERSKTKTRTKLAGRACVATLLQRHVSACLKRVCVIRDAGRVCVIQVWSCFKPTVSHGWPILDIAILIFPSVRYVSKNKAQ